MTKGPFIDWLDDLRLAASFLTRLPLPPGPAHDEGPATAEALKRSLRYYPLVGAGLGLLGGLAYWAAAGLDLPPLIAALIALGAIVAATGALHEDGLADLADGLGARGGRPERLAAMRDSRIGAYGVLALIFSLALRAAALAALADPAAVLAALVAAHSLSRGLLPTLFFALAPARQDGLGAAFTRPEIGETAIPLAIAGAIAWLALGFGPALLALLVAGAGVAGVGAVAAKRLGGYTGDVLGAAQQKAEILVLIVLVALD